VRLRLALALLLAAAGAPARAGELDVNPVLVELSRAEKSAVVTIRNRGQEPARYQIALYGWDQSSSGEMKLADTQDIVAFPRTLSLAPGEARIVRVGAAVPFGPVEKAYRLFIEEMPPPAKPDAASKVQVLSRIGLPVFLAPERALEKAEIADLRVAAGKVEFALRNPGNVRIRPPAVKLVAEDAAGKAVHEQPLEAWYVLAGGERRYSVALPPEHCAGVRSVTIEVALAKEPLRARAAMPQGGCGP
jgi:fimbrial chaperone protein